MVPIMNWMNETKRPADGACREEAMDPKQMLKEGTGEAGSAANEAVQSAENLLKEAGAGLDPAELAKNAGGQILKGAGEQLGIDLDPSMLSKDALKKINPKKILADRINNYLNIAIGTVTGTFAGSAWQTVKGFVRDPEYYLSKPGAWYMGLIVSGLEAGALIVGVNVAKKIIRKKLGIDLDGGK